MWRILIVDDDELTRELISRMLDTHAVCVKVADGQRALDLFGRAHASNQCFDAILLDIAMPDMDGVAVLEKIRELEARDRPGMEIHVPILMITGRQDEIVRAFSSGCDDYLLKPISPGVLVEKIQKVIAAQQRPQIEEG